jgi:hypothetical protein
VTDEQRFTFTLEVKVAHTAGEECSYDEIREDVRVALTERMTGCGIYPSAAGEYEITEVKER